MTSANKTERFEMRIEQNVLDSIDDWRDKQTDKPSRAEAIRRLIETGLTTSKQTEPQLSDGEKLIISLLCEQHKQLKISSELDPALLESIMYGGHYWALNWKYSNLLHSHRDSPKTRSEVVDTLDMWSFIEAGYAKLSKKDKELVAVEAKLFGNNVMFPGFDGNNEGEHYAIARFLIDDMERFTKFKNRDLDSHSPKVGAYKRMWKLFEPMRVNIGYGQEMGASDIIQLLNEMEQSDNRNYAA